MRIQMGVAAPFIWFNGMGRYGRQLPMFNEMKEEEEKPVMVKEMVTA